MSYSIYHYVLSIFTLSSMRAYILCVLPAVNDKDVEATLRYDGRNLVIYSYFIITFLPEDHTWTESLLGESLRLSPLDLGESGHWDWANQSSVSQRRPYLSLFGPAAPPFADWALALKPHEDMLSCLFNLRGSASGFLPPPSAAAK